MSDDIDDVNTDVVDKRSFILMASPSEGQDMAATMGFSTPSEDVREAETMAIATQWVLLATLGQLSYIKRASEWITEFISSLFDDEGGLPEDAVKKTVSAYYAFGAALIAYMSNAGAIELVPVGKTSENLEDFISMLPEAFTVIAVDDMEDDDE